MVNIGSILQPPPIRIRILGLENDMRSVWFDDFIFSAYSLFPPENPIKDRRQRRDEEQCKKPCGFVGRDLEIVSQNIYQAENPFDEK